MGGVRGTGDVMRDARLPVMEKKIEGMDWGFGGATGVYSIGTKETAKLRKGRMDRKRAGREW